MKNLGPETAMAPNGTVAETTSQSATDRRTVGNLAQRERLARWVDDNTNDNWSNGDGQVSSYTRVGLSVDGGKVNLWSYVLFSESKGERTLVLAPGQMVVIGRQQGGKLEYLDPSFVPTQLVPDSGKTVLTMNYKKDSRVSRGHFTLRGSTQGILLVNGVPGVDGGIRPPTNWTFLLEPVRRLLKNGEEYLVERGASVRIGLPNETRILLRAS
jgi:hypothetical protein